MDAKKFIVFPEAKKHEPIVDMWATPVPDDLKARLNSFPRDKRKLIHESTRMFLNYITEEFSKLA